MYRLNRAKVKAEIAKVLLEVEKHNRELAVPDVRSPKLLADGPGESQRVDGPTKLEKLATKLLEDHDDNSVLIPPGESTRLYNRLSNRGARELYDGNTRVLAKLGYEVRDMDVQITERDAQ